MVEAQPEGLLGLRNRELLLGFDSARRRSEIGALDVEDLAFISQGIVLTLRKAKTDQEGAGRQIGVRRGLGVPLPKGVGGAHPPGHARSSH
jgi:hypothetical protein